MSLCVRGDTPSKETYYSVKRDLLECQKRPTVTLECQRRHTISEDTDDRNGRFRVTCDHGGDHKIPHSTVYHSRTMRVYHVSRVTTAEIAGYSIAPIQYRRKACQHNPMAATKSTTHEQCAGVSHLTCNKIQWLQPSLPLTNHEQVCYNSPAWRQILMSPARGVVLTDLQSTI